MTVIDKASPLPYYEQLAELLRREIADRQASGETYQLPFENELAARYGLSRATVRHALDELEHDGWIYRQKGVGSFAPVRRPRRPPLEAAANHDPVALRRQYGHDLLLGGRIDQRELTSQPPVGRPAG